MLPIPPYREGARHPQAQACADCAVRSAAMFGALDDTGLPRREAIGAMLHLTMETASRQVSALRRDGVLTLASGRSARLYPAALPRQLLAAERA